MRRVPQDISTREIAVLDALLKLHDAFGTIYQDQALASLFPRSGQAVDTLWQAHCPSGIDAGQCVLDREHQRATCPQGKTSRSLEPPCRKRHLDLIKSQFSTTDCQSCSRRGNCVCATSKYPRRTLLVRPQAQHSALQAAQQRQRTATFQQADALCAGVEATISQEVRAFDLRRSRYPGLLKTHLQHPGIATAINLVRLVAWLDDNLPALTRRSAFQRLCLAA